MTLLKDATLRELRDELLRREAAMMPPPKRVETVDWRPLEDALEDYRTWLCESAFNEDENTDWRRIIAELCLACVFGQHFNDWLRTVQTQSGNALELDPLTQASSLETSDLPNPARKW